MGLLPLSGSPDIDLHLRTHSSSTPNARDQAPRLGLCHSPPRLLCTFLPSPRVSNRQKARQSCVFIQQKPFEKPEIPRNRSRQRIFALQGTKLLVGKDRGSRLGFNLTQGSAWFWLATQNLADFPDAAQTMLNMIEWWIFLNRPPAEIEEIARFKKLTPAQKALLLSASKASGKYTEGVVLSKNLETLFRALRPSLYLADSAHLEQALSRSEMRRLHSPTQ